MSVAARFTVPAADTALGTVFDREPGTRFQMERVAGSQVDDPLPFVWATGADREAIHDALRADPSVDVRETLVDGRTERLYRLTFDEPMRRFVDTLFEQGGIARDVTGSEGRWSFRLLFPERQALSTAHQRLADEGYQVDVTSVICAEQSFERGVLTVDQFEALTAAYRGGYYDIPRSASLQDLAEEFDITYQSLSERLRRGHGALVGDALETEIASRSATGRMASRPGD